MQFLRDVRTQRWQGAHNICNFPVKEINDQDDDDQYGKNVQHNDDHSIDLDSAFNFDEQPDAGKCNNGSPGKWNQKLFPNDQYADQKI